MLSENEQNLICKCFDDNLCCSNNYYELNKSYIKIIIDKLNKKSVIIKEQYLWEKIACSKEILNWIIDRKLIDDEIIWFLQNIYGEQLENKFCELSIPLENKKEYEEYIKYLKYIAKITATILNFKNYPQLTEDFTNIENRKIYKKIIKLLPDEYQYILLLKLGLLNYKKYDIEEIATICSISKMKVISLLEKGLKSLEIVISIYEEISNQNKEALLKREKVK